MSTPLESTGPTAADYLALFERYRDAMGTEDPGQVYLVQADERFRLLFDQACQLLSRPSAFNHAMPQEFRRTAQRYLRKEAATVKQMRDPQVRHFMLSDLYDYVHLCQRIGQPRW